jgi:hypothetical protein
VCGGESCPAGRALPDSSSGVPGPEEPIAAILLPWVCGVVGVGEPSLVVELDSEAWLALAELAFMPPHKFPRALLAKGDGLAAILLMDGPEEFAVLCLGLDLEAPCKSILPRGRGARSPALSPSEGPDTGTPFGLSTLLLMTGFS